MEKDPQELLAEEMAKSPHPVNVKMIYVPPEQWVEWDRTHQAASAPAPPQPAPETLGEPPEEEEPPPRRRARPSYHLRRCTVCKHPERKAIEEAFLHWRSARDTALEFKLPGCTAIYRHAHATGLFARRSRNLRFALEHLIENAERACRTAAGVVQAVRAYARINSRGQWVEPPTTHIVAAAPSPEAARWLASGSKGAARRSPAAAQKALPALPKRASSSACKSSAPRARRAQPNRYKMKNKD